MLLKNKLEFLSLARFVSLAYFLKSKLEAYPARCSTQVIVSSSNVRLSLKNLQNTNTLAYSAASLLMQRKKVYNIGNQLENQIIFGASTFFRMIFSLKAIRIKTFRSITSVRFSFRRTTLSRAIFSIT